MFDVTTWLKTWTGALLACLLVLAVAAPSLRSGLCSADLVSGMKTNAVAEATVVAQADDQDTADRIDGEVCGIGHCHHSPSLIGIAMGGQTHVSVDRIRLIPAPPHMPPSRMPDGPNEPPRS